MNSKETNNLIDWIIDLVHSGSSGNFCCLLCDQEKNTIKIYSPKSTLSIFDFLETSSLLHASLKDASELEHIVEIKKIDPTKITVRYNTTFCVLFCNSLSEEEVEAVAFLTAFFEQEQEDSRGSHLYLNVLVEKNFPNNTKLMFLKKDVVQKFKNSIHSKKTILKDSIFLTEKELAVLKLFCEEKTAKEIGVNLNISPRTVESIKDKLVLKLGTKTTTGLIRFEYLCR